MRNLLTLLAALTLLASASSCCRSAGAGVGRGVTDFTSGVGSGVDEGVLVNLKFTDDATKQGLATTTAKRSGKKINVYVTSRAPFNGQLIAKAFNKEGGEIGRSVIPVTFIASDAKYVQFVFPNEMDTQLVHEYRIDVVK